MVSLTETRDRDDLASWTASFGITHEVAGDYAREVWNTYAHLSVGRPQYIVIDRDFAVVHAGNNGPAAEAFAASLL